MGKEMQTWVDGYIADLGLLAREEGPATILTKEIISDAGGSMKKYGYYEGKTFRKIPNFVLGRILMDIAAGMDTSSLSENEAIFSKLDQIVSYFSTPSDDYETSAIKLNEELAETFVGAKAPNVSKKELKLDHPSIIYIDVPTHVIPVNKDYIRAIFVIVETTITKIACILDNTNGSNVRVFTFTFGDVLEKVADDSRLFQEVAEDMQVKVENFITLALLYHQVAIDIDKTVIPRIVPNSVTKLSVKKANAKHHKNSLFDVHYLKAPKGHFGMRRHHKTFTTSGSWDVRGHFRWQVCGVGKLKRKLIWIVGYVKGTGEKHMHIDILTK